MGARLMGALFIPKGASMARKTLVLPATLRPRRAMASPPTVTFGTATAGGTLTKTYWAGTNSASWTMPSTPVRSHFSYARTLVGYNSAGAVAAGTSGVGGATVTAGLTATKTPGMFQASFMHYGEMLEIVVAQTGTSLMVRVDDEYVELAPRTLGGGGGATSNFMKLAFGTRGYRRIDVIGNSSFTFRGVNVEPGDLAAPAAIRGPRTICLGDSFTQAGVQGWHAFLSDAMGWDDIWAAGVGGTGWDSNNVGSALPFHLRIATDVIPYSPDVVFLHGSVNDAVKTPATCGANAATATAAIKAALPDCLVIGGYNAVGGVETMTANHLAVMDAVQAGIVSAGGIWLNPVALPLEYNGTVPSATLASTHAAGRLGANPNTAPYATSTNLTGLYCPGVAGAGTSLRIGSTVEIGTGAVRERVVLTGMTMITGSHVSYSFQGALQYAHSAGETVTEVGASYMTGTGQLTATTGWGNADTLVSADNVHPSPEGQQMIGLVNAMLLRDWLGRMTPVERSRGPAFAV